jgi:polar amino acid transport system substrate-binding protein
MEVVHMKKVMLACVALVATAAVATPALASKSAPPVKTAGVLTVGLSLPSPGFQVGTIRGTDVLHPKGMEIELAQDIAKKLGLKSVKFFNVSNFPNIYSPAPKPYDLALAEVTITPARAKVVSFSTPYYDANQGVLIKKGLSPQPKSIADLKKLTLCAQTGTTGADFIKTKIRPTKAALYPQTTTVMYQQVQSGRCDAAVYDAPILGGQKAQTPNAYGPIVGQIKTNEQYGIVFEKSQTALRTQVNAVIKGLVADGTVSKLAKKYLTTDVSKLPIFK